MDNLELHTPVLKTELINGIAPSSGDILCDATCGDGGYLADICTRYSNDVSLVGIDADYEAIERTRQRFSTMTCTPTLIQGNFRNIQSLLKRHDIQVVNHVLFDLGLSSYQIDQSGRGFSFRSDDPLHMAFDLDAELTARDVVNKWDENVIETIIRGYGEERYAKRIARAITASRLDASIETTAQLAEIISNAVPGHYRRARLHPATRTFQAIRIAVNDEITSLEVGLTEAFNMLAENGRCGVISFHSLEDRIVKNIFRSFAQKELGKIHTKKPIIASDQEKKNNPRSRSAKLRIIEKISYDKENTTPL